jgi:D-alanine-D-alanine ligase
VPLFEPAEGAKKGIDMNIIVLAGGISTERTVSISSGEQVCAALRRKGHRAVLLDVYFGTKSCDGTFFPEEYDIGAAAGQMREMTALVEETKKNRKEFFGENVLALCRKADIVFLALHGENGENGKIQAAFDLMGISYTGTDYLSSAICMDKGLSRILLKEGGVPMAKGCSLKKEAKETKAEALGMSFPCIVKPCCGGSSVGVAVAENEQEFAKALSEAFSYEDEVVIEEYIKGREFSVALIHGKALPIIEIAPKQGFYDYKNKYEAGSTVETCPALLTEEQTEKMQGYAQKAYRILRLHTYARIDFMMDENGDMYCLEANTLPGMTPTSLIPQEAAAAGMGYDELCEKIIEISR